MSSGPVTHSYRYHRTTPWSLRPTETPDVGKPRDFGYDYKVGASNMDLLTNAIESIRAGVEDYQDGSHGRLLAAVRSIHAGILLLYKEALRRASPAGSNEVFIKAKSPAQLPDGSQQKLVLLLRLWPSGVQKHSSANCSALPRKERLNSPSSRPYPLFATESCFDNQSPDY
jgi:hypothetical protein